MTDTAIARQEQAALAPQTITPMDLIARASAAGASIEHLQQLFELKLRVEADEARKAFSESFGAFKAEAVRIVKNVEVSAGPLAGKRYADLFGVVNAITPSLSKHGLSHSWRLSKDDKDWIEVTCTIRHVLGHSESVFMGSAPDIGPGRNAIQARASAKTYLERYTLLAATGMAAAGTDDDGVGAGAGIPEPQLVASIEDIRNANTPTELKSIFTAAYRAAEAIGDKAAMNEFIREKDKRKAELK